MAASLSNAGKFTKEGEVALRVRKVADGREWVELAGDRKAEPRPAVAPCCERIGLGEILEQFCLLLKMPLQCRE